MLYSTLDPDKVLRISMLEISYSTLDPDIEISKEQNPSENLSQPLNPGNEFSQSAKMHFCTYNQ